ncbi:MAG: hypothetical protein M3P51_09060 [Chloroflexota bacterium]|nr:hypothetical protein [Chloroflexota bacterium]
MLITITKYSCGCRGSVTTHPSRSKGRTEVKREDAPMECNRHATPQQRAQDDALLRSLRGMGVRV